MAPSPSLEDPALFEPFAVFWRNRFLIMTLTRRDVAARYRGSALGMLWSLLTPALMIFVYTFVFSFVFGLRWGAGGEGKGYFALLVFAGIIVHGFFSDCIVRAPGLVVGNAGYVKKVVFPVEVLAWVTVLSALTQASISWFVLLCFALAVNGTLTPMLVLAPIVFSPLVLIALATTWILSAAGVFLRDLGQAMGVVSTVLLFLSPTMYPLAAVPEAYRWFIHLNFLTFFMEQFRAVVIHGQLPAFASLALAGLASIALAAIGLRLFNRARRGFNDVL